MVKKKRSQVIVEVRENGRLINNPIVADLLDTVECEYVIYADVFGQQIERRFTVTVRPS